MQKDINLNDNDWRVHIHFFLVIFKIIKYKKEFNSKKLDMLNDFIGCRGSCVPLLFKFSKIIFEKKMCVSNLCNI